jgi:hypothetical protein
MSKNIPSTYGQSRTLSFRRLSGPNRDINDDFGGGDGRPKFKFNFTVHIHFRPSEGYRLDDGIRAVKSFCDDPKKRDTVVSSFQTDDGTGAVEYDIVGDDVIPVEGFSEGGAPPNDESLDMKEMIFPIKQASRPNITFTYEDVNYYNYRTKVATKTDYGTFQLTFYDDVQNTAHFFFDSYLNKVSPVSNINPFTDAPVNDALDEAGRGLNNFNFGNRHRAFGGSGSIGPLADDAKLGFIKRITIRHYYITQGLGDIDFIDYVYVNPKVVNMTLDELDMSDTEVNLITLNFNYDYVYIDRGTKQPDEPAPADDTNTRDPEIYRFARLAGAARRATIDAINEERIEDTRGNVGNSRYETFDFNRVRARVLDVQREIARIRRLDTLPDISILEVGDSLIPPITGDLPPIFSRAGDFVDGVLNVSEVVGDVLTDLPNIPDVPDIDL